MSILKVDTINEKTTGNGVIIPSGQTLDVSAGTFVPSANQVVKTSLSRSQSAMSASTTASYTDVLSLSFTPTFNNSVLLISGAVSGIAYQSTGAYNGSRWRYLITPSGGTATEDFINYYQFHEPTGERYGGMIPLSFYYTVSSTVSHTVQIQALSWNSTTNVFRNRNGEISTLIIQEIKQ